MASNSHTDQVPCMPQLCVSHVPSPQCRAQLIKFPANTEKHCPCTKPHMKRSMRIIWPNPHSHLTPREHVYLLTVIDLCVCVCVVLPPHLLTQFHLPYSLLSPQAENGAWLRAGVQYPGVE